MAAEAKINKNRHTENLGKTGRELLWAVKSLVAEHVCKYEASVSSSRCNNKNKNKTRSTTHTHTLHSCAHTLRNLESDTHQADRKLGS